MATNTNQGKTTIPLSQVKIPSESQLRRMAKKDYMSQAQLAFFLDRLKQLRIETVEHIDQVRYDLTHAERETDMLDRAALEDEHALKLRIVDRQLKLLKKIDSAIERIRDGSYGWCDQTGEAIGIERLLLRPTATLSIEAKEVAEVIERSFADIKEYSSTGTPTEES